MNSAFNPSTRATNWHSPIRAVALDMDGLILNTEDLYHEAISDILARRGKKFRPEVRRSMMGQSAEKAWGCLILSEQLGVTWQQLQAECDEIFEELLPRCVAPMPGLIPLLDFLDAMELPRCVATSSVRSFARSALGTCGILDRLGFIVTSEDVEHSKPNPDIYLLAAQRLGVRPEEMLVLEDSGNGAKAGVASGACVVAVPTEHSRDHAFHGVAACATSLADPCIYSLLPSKNR